MPSKKMNRLSRSTCIAKRLVSKYHIFFSLFVCWAPRLNCASRSVGCISRVSTRTNSNPKLSCIVITVKHQSKLTKRKTRIYAVIPVRILRQGYRACPLFDVVNGHALPPYVQLFCHFTVKDG
uniref:Uncharacterized protein n=1 Tax=Rhodosorus marinus TaxID=101924 RepID=A0A7S3EQT9_9RHOD